MHSVKLFMRAIGHQITRGWERGGDSQQRAVFAAHLKTAVDAVDYEVFWRIHFDCLAGHAERFQHVPHLAWQRTVVEFFQSFPTEAAITVHLMRARSVAQGQDAPRAAAVSMPARAIHS